MDRAAVDALFRSSTVLLAPMEEVTDAVFRAVCRARGATVCFTEFVHVDHLIAGERGARRKLALDPDDQPTAIQIYGADARQLAEAAEIVAEASPAFIDINCGCWVPRVVGRGAGAAWLRDPDAMVAMVKDVVKHSVLPVTVKTRIGWGPATEMPIVELAQRLEQAGVAAITIHGRTAKQGHDGAADWSWAGRAQAKVRIPVVVNGDIRSASDARRALAETQCAAVMIGRRAIEHPWVFREARALLETGRGLPRPSAQERIALCREHLTRSEARRGSASGARAVRRFLPAYVRPLPGAETFARAIAQAMDSAAMYEAIDALEAFEPVASDEGADRTDRSGRARSARIRDEDDDSAAWY